MARVTLDASSVSRVIGNALAFLPAASKVRHVLVDFRESCLIVMGTDGYTAGRDSAQLLSAEGVPPEGIPVLIEVAQAKEVDGYARKTRRGLLEIVVSPEGTLTVTGEEDGGVTVPWEETEHVLAIYERVEDVLTKTEALGRGWPGTLMFDPSLMSRFGKVKADNTSRMADVSATDDRAPILIKIGPTFTGLCMPIRRQNQGIDGQWSLPESTSEVP